MAKFRMIDTEFWNDPQVQEQFTPEDKLFYLYLMTNPATKQVGIYTITKKKMAFELGYSIETVNSLMNRFQSHHRLIDYDEMTREILLLRWSETAYRKGGKPVNDLVLSELVNIKRTDWIARIAPLIPIDSVREVVLSYMKKNGIESYDESYHESYDESYHDTPTRTKKEELRTKKEELRTKTIVQQVERFEEWWNLYNHKIGRKNCVPKYQKAVNDFGEDRVFEGTKAYLAYWESVNANPKRSLDKKHPSTFLNGEHFNDEYESLMEPKGANHSGSHQPAHQKSNDVSGIEF